MDLQTSLILTGGIFSWKFHFKAKKAYKYPKGSIVECDFGGELVSSCTFYKNAGSREKAFTVEKGETVTICSYRYIKNQLYVRVGYLQQ